MTIPDMMYCEISVESILSTSFEAPRPRLVDRACGALAGQEGDLEISEDQKGKGR